MSKEVDERVVEMRFDNAKFEKNTRQTMKTLQELNESLKLEGAEKGFEKIEDASAKVDFDKMQGAVEGLSSKFSALEVMGVTALVRITNQAIDTGEKLVKSLSIDQVTSGWNKYAQKTASVQTIMNATGKSITKVNSYLDKLMWYSDETSYGFTDMTASLGQLTAAGGDIDKLIPMIMGIANATAYAGKGASEFSRVIYNLNQSYSQGYLSLMDWKSVELAGVATAELKQLLIDTAVEQGKLKKGAVNVGSFGSTLSKKWADKEVMEAGFGKLAEFTMAVKNLQESNPKQYSTAAKAIEALEDKYDEVTVKAFKAAQEAKSFTEAVDATKDAVSSGWMETFDILFGNYEEAKGFWSDLADEFWDIFAGGQDARNNWLRSAFDSGLDQMLGTEGFSDATDNYTNLLQKSLIKTGVLTEDAVTEAGSFQKALEESSVTAEQLASVVQDAAAYYGEIAALSDKELKAKGYDRTKVDALAKAYASMVEKIQNGNVSLDDFSGKMNQLSGREHLFNGILNILEGINSVLQPMRDAFGEVFMMDGSPLYNLLKGFDDLTGKFRLSEETAAKMQKVFKGVFSVLNIGLKTVKVAVKTVMAIVSQLMDLLSPVTDLLLNIGSGIGNVLTLADMSLGQAESLTDVLGILVGAVAALVSPIKELWDGFRSFVRGGDVEETKEQFGAFGAVVNAVGGVLDKFKIGSVSASGIIGKAMSVLGGVFMMAFDGIGALIGSAFSGFKDAGKKVEEFKDDHVPMLENIRDTVLSIPEKAKETLKDFGGTIGSVMGSIASSVKTALNAVKEFFNLQDGADLYRLLALLDVGAVALAIWAVSKALTGMQKALKGVTDAAAKVLSNPVTDLLNSMKKAVDSWTKQHTTDNFVNVAKEISIAIGALSASIYMLSKIEDPMKAAQALGSVIAMLFGLVIAMKALAKEDITGLDSAKIFATMISFSTGLLAFSASIKGIVKAMKLLKYFNKDQMNNAVGGLMAIVAVMLMMAGAISGLNYLNNKLVAGSKIKVANIMKGISAYLVVATAMLEMAGVLYLIGNMDESKFMNAYGAMFAMSVVLELMVGVVGVLNLLNNKMQAASKNSLKGITDGVSAFLVVATSMVIVAGAVKLFSSINNLDDAMLAAMGTMVTMAGAIAIMSKFGGKAKKMKAGATAMLIASASLIVIAGALRQMTEAMQADDSGAGFAGLSIALIGLAAAIYVLGKNAIESMGAAAALAAMGFALIEMAQAIKMLSDLSVSDLVKSVIALGVALFGLVGAAAMLPAATAGITGVAGACLLLATALLILTPAFKGLASLSLGEVVAGVVGMAGVLLGLFAIGANPAISVGFGALSVSLISLAKAFSIFAGGLIKLSVAIGILELVSMFAGPIKEVIVGAADDIRVALDTIVITLCNVLNDCAEPISGALVTLCKILIQSIVDLIAWAWEGDGGEGTGIKGALDQLWANIMAWLEEKMHFDFGSSIFNASDWVDTFTANDRLFGKILGTVTDPFLAPFGTSMNDLGNQLEDSINGVKETAEEAGKESQQVLEDTKDVVEETTDQVDKASKVMPVAAKKVEQNGYIAMDAWNDYGKTTIYVAQAASDGSDAMGDFADSADAAGTAMSNAAAETTDAANTTQQNGDRISEVATQIKSEEGTVEKAAVDAVDNITSAGNEKAEENGESTTSHWYDAIFSAIDNYLPGARDKIQGAVNSMFGNVTIPSVNDIVSSSGNSLGTWKDILSGNFGNSGLTGADLDEDIKPDDNKDKNPTRTTTNKKKTKSSGTKKTVAQQIEEKYKTKLEANKTQREILDNEYELWQEENQYSADIDTQMAKKAENAAAEIANQTERVTIAQQKYDEMTKRWGKDKQETKEAYNDLLEEKTSLAKLKAEQYTNLFEAATTRYDADLETLEKEYNLWSTQNDKTATKLDKLDRETQYQNDELAIKQKKVDNAKEQYETMRREYGESDLRTIEAHNDLLDAQAEALEIQNDLAHKELDRLDILIENIQTAQSRMQSRMDILSTVYDDGSLKEREDAYKQAVEEYGKDSKQAKKAQFQGTTSAILSTVTALKNLNYQMQQTKKYEEELSGMTPGTEEYDNKMSDILSSKSSFIGFASNLADALNMEDTGKKAMLILANSMQDHWKEIDTAMKNVMDKVTKGMSDGLKATFKDVFDTMSSDEFAQMGTEFISTVTSALQGDWAGAVASGIAFAMDFAFSNTGKKIQSDMVKLFSDNVIPAIKSSVGSIDKLVNGEGGLVAILQNGSVQAGNALAGSGGITAALGSIGTTLTEVGGVLMGFLSEFWWVFLIIGAIAAVVAAIVGGIAWSKKKKSDAAKDAGSDLDKDFADGVTGGKDQVDDAVDDMTKDTTDSLTAAIATIKRVMDDDYQYEPTITPVLDMTDAGASMDAWNQAFNDYPMNADVSKKMAAQVDATAELQNEARMQSNAELLNAVNVLGDRMDSVGQSIQGMNVVVDGKTTIGWIDAGLGARAARRAR